MEMCCRASHWGLADNRKVALGPSIKNKNGRKNVRHELGTAGAFTGHSICLFQSNRNKVITTAVAKKKKKRKEKKKEAG